MVYPGDWPRGWWAWEAGAEAYRNSGLGSLLRMRDWLLGFNAEVMSGLDRLVVGFMRGNYVGGHVGTSYQSILLPEGLG